ncbi:hypothetical protein GDO81_019272 [Engystomops pustulosus]|uniref:C3H1-type domain-containing protein n=1 Tax=Engystomops pustulosus TaxID=76066 RepID=A0AAV6ZG33_ENGPU|nr:hypothetical protein GDO81_019272 [Engystomops pustulosus]
MSALSLLTMEDVVQQLLLMVKREGAEDWLRSCLSAPPMAPGDAVPDVSRASAEERPRRERRAAPAYSSPVEPKRRRGDTASSARQKGRDPEYDALVRLPQDTSRQRYDSTEYTTIPTQSLQVGARSNASGAVSAASKVHATAAAIPQVQEEASGSSPYCAQSSGGSRQRSAAGETIYINPSKFPNAEALVAEFIKNMSAALARKVPPPVPVAPTLIPPVQSTPGDIVRSVGVAKVCTDDPLIYKMPPLGYHLSSSVKEKIWRREYVDILSLIPSYELFLRHDEEDVPRTFDNWLQAFCIYASVLGERYPELCSALFQHVYIVLEAYRDFGGMAWFYYDQMFRQNLSVCPTKKWGGKDIALWLKLMLPQAVNAVSWQIPTTARRKGVCFAFNEGHCKWQNCRFKHICSFCSGAHSMSHCFKRAAQGNLM